MPQDLTAAVLTALAGLTLFAAGCTAEANDPVTEGTSPAGPSYPSPSRQSVPSGAEAEAQLKKLYPAGQSHSITGFGPMESSFGNSLASRPARKGMIDFIFTCTGESSVSIKVLDGDAPISGASGRLDCGAEAFKRTLPVTPESTISFRGEAVILGDGGYAYAYVGDLR